MMHLIHLIQARNEGRTPAAINRLLALSAIALLAGNFLLWFGP